MEALMTKAKKIVLLCAIVVIVALLVVAGVTNGSNASLPCPDCDGVAECETCAGEATVRGSLWALLPPVIAIGLALITKEVYSSLFIGILSGALLYSNFSFTGTMMPSSTRKMKMPAVPETAEIRPSLMRVSIVPVKEKLE